MKHSASRRIPPELQQALVTLVANLVPSVFVLVCLWYLQVSIYLWALVAVLLGFLSLFTVVSVWRAAHFQYRNLHNLLESLGKGNFTLRGASGGDGSYGKLVTVVNDLADTLHKQRMQAEEKQLLLLKVINQIDVAILAWDDNNRIQLLNPAATALLDINVEKSAEEQASTEAANVLPASIRFANDMPLGKAQLRDLEFGNSRGRFILFKERFIADGNTHHLLFMTNIAGILRVEEKKAWQDLIRVLSHEINNSLAPLTSLSRSLSKQVHLREQDQNLAGELVKGLTIIEKRAETLATFLQNYKKLASLPEPVLAPVDLKQLTTGVCELFSGQQIQIDGLPIVVKLDAGQIEQVLINLLKNAVEANDAAATKAQPGTHIDVSWHCDQRQLTLLISDTGNGIASPDNLFTPFYTTKRSGSGIGLSLCRQIVEAHNGQLRLDNRQDRSGCTVSIILPLLQE